MKEKIKTLMSYKSVKFFLPIVIGFGVIGFTGLFIVADLKFKFWSLITGYFFPPLGKETIIPTGVAFGIHPVVLALSIAFVDIVIALFLIWNYDLAKKIPLVGKFMEKVESIGKSSSDKYGWIKPLRFIGIALFVMIPFQGSGGLVGSIVGRLIGMKPWNVFFAISTGSITGCLLIAYFAEVILNVFVKNFLLGFLIVAILLVIGIMVLINKKVKNKSK